MRHLGEVKLYHRDRSWGFIQEIERNDEHPTEQFFHINDVDGRLILRVGDVVTFEIGESKSRPGKTQALRVQLAKRDELPAPDAPATEVQRG
jgi:cold shock CspA family protein